MSNHALDCQCSEEQVTYLASIEVNKDGRFEGVG